MAEDLKTTCGITTQCQGVLQGAHANELLLSATLHSANLEELLYTLQTFCEHS